MAHMTEAYPIEDFLADFAQAMPGLFSLALRLLGNEEDARDLIQDTSMTAWEKRSQLRSREALVPWTRRILMNHFLRAARKNGELRLMEWQDYESEIEAPSDTPSPEAEALVAETIREVRDVCFTAMVRHLTIPQRAVFCLVETFGTPIEETADILGLSVPAAKGLLHRARRHVSAYFAKYCGLIVPSNSCSCSSWQDFIGDRAMLSAEVRRRGMVADFTGPPPSAVDPAITATVLRHFRDLPHAAPDREWYLSLVSLIRKGRPSDNPARREGQPAPRG